MNYIYDIVLNFNEDYYDCYEWKITDNITRFDSIPVYKVSFLEMNTILTHNISFDLDDKNVLITDYERVIGLSMDDRCMISTLLYDEEDEVLNIITDMNLDYFRFNIISDKSFTLLSRNERERNNYLIVKLDYLYKNSCNDEISYLYSLFSNKRNSFRKKYEYLVSIVNNNFFQEINKIYNVFKLENKSRLESYSYK